MKSTIKTLTALLILMFTIVSFQNCEQPNKGTTLRGTETGDPSFNLRLSAFDQQALIDYLIPKAHANVTGVALCIHQIRFKANNDANDPGVNANIEVGYIELNPSGTDLGAIDVEPGMYTRIDIMVKDQCSENMSLAIQNDSGTYTSTQPQILRFTGDITIDSETRSLTLNIVPFVNFFNGVMSNGELDSGTQAIEGDY